MDPLGCTMGALGLVSLFTTCMQCFEYIQYGRQFGESYGTAVLKLDVCRLRLARWAKSIGLTDNAKLLESKLSTREIEIAINLLGNIAEAFQNVARLSRRYEATKKLMCGDGDGEALDVLAETDLSERLHKIHLQAKNQIVKRQNSVSNADKARWALYEKKRFDDLVRDIKDHTDALIENFPAAVVLQGQLAAEEVKLLAGDANDLALLKDASADTDEILSEAVEKEGLLHEGHRYENIRVSGYAKAFFGNDIAYGARAKGNTYGTIVIDGHAIVHAGNVYRARGHRQIDFEQETKRPVARTNTLRALMRYR